MGQVMSIASAVSNVVISMGIMDELGIGIFVGHIASALQMIRAEIQDWLV